MVVWHGRFVPIVSSQDHTREKVFTGENMGGSAQNLMQTHQIFSVQAICVFGECCKTEEKFGEHRRLYFRADLTSNTVSRLRTLVLTWQKRNFSATGSNSGLDTKWYLWRHRLSISKRPLYSTIPTLRSPQDMNQGADFSKHIL